MNGISSFSWSKVILCLQILILSSHVVDSTFKFGDCSEYGHATRRDVLAQLSIPSGTASATEWPCPRACSSRCGLDPGTDGGGGVSKSLVILAWWKIALAGHPGSRTSHWVDRGTLGSTCLCAQACFPTPCFHGYWSLISTCTSNSWVPSPQQ